MRRLREILGGVLTCLATLCGCGGSGSGSVAAPVTAAGSLPVTAPAIVAANGPLTILSAGPVIGSTILPSSPAAIFTVDSGTTPKQLAAGSPLTTYSISISDVAGGSLAARRRAFSALRVALYRDPDVRIPDAPGSEVMTRQLLSLQRRSNGVERSMLHVRRGQAYALNDRKTFELQGGTINGSGANPTPIPMTATLVAQSAHANVWLDNAVYLNPLVRNAEFPSGTGDFAAVAREFETIFAIETQAFGPAYTTGIVNFAQCDANGVPLAQAPPRPDTTGATDAHMNIVITDELKGSGEGGYFYGLDMLDQSEANCVAGAQKPVVNGLPMLVIESDNYPASSGGASETFPANNETYWLQGDMPQTLAHEFQHYLHFVNKYLEEHVQNPDNSAAGTLDDSYIDEGCSVLAQDLVAGPAVNMRESPAFVRAFLLEPGDFSLTAFTGYQPNALDATGADAPYGFFHNTAGNYGYAYLFVRYLYDRFGPGALKAIYAETNFGRAREPDTGTASAAAGGEAFAQLFREFTTALAIHSGGSVPEMTTDPAYRFDASVILRGATQTYSRRLPPYNVRNIVQPGPLDPQTFVNNAPTGTVHIGGGQTATVLLLDGGALFITPQQPWTRGATVSASGPIAGGGSLGQGPLPTPAPAYY